MLYQEWRRILGTIRGKKKSVTRGELDFSTETLEARIDQSIALHILKESYFHLEFCNLAELQANVKVE